MSLYTQIAQEHQKIIKKLEQKISVLSFFRLLCIGSVIYLFYLMLYRKEEQWGYMAAVLAMVFFTVVVWYTRLQQKVKYHKVVQQINLDEEAFLQGRHQFDGGAEFVDPTHPYSYDLDLFGTNSIYQFINRTATHSGRRKLAAYFLRSSSVCSIRNTQCSVNELSENINFRQRFQALGILSESTEAVDRNLKEWTERDDPSIPVFFKISSVLFPVLLILFSILYLFNAYESAATWCLYLFMINLFIFGVFSKRVLNEIGSGNKISNTITKYAAMLNVIENEPFQSEKLTSIQNRIKKSNLTASVELSRLGGYYEKLDTIANLFVNLLLNGAFQYHYWIYRSLLFWKKKHRKSLWNWIEIIGEVDALNSMANYAKNNPEYSYPQMDKKNKTVQFKELGHPLIPKKKRVRNSVSFTDKQFVILTGSNMSGKSTFLRTVGLNLVLSGAGLPIDAKKAVFYPYPLWVSMRLTDSLSDSESFFFAEVKRLKKITEESEHQEIFVLLDEILKGTNSEDKKSGTIGVIERLHKNRVKGIIATHDLEVCKVADKYSHQMSNKRFEVEIINDELVFDYQLKEGICENKNATFIMKQMGII